MTFTGKRGIHSWGHVKERKSERNKEREKKARRRGIFVMMLISDCGGQVFKRSTAIHRYAGCYQVFMQGFVDVGFSETD